MISIPWVIYDQEDKKEPTTVKELIEIIRVFNRKEVIILNQQPTTQLPYL